MLGVLAKVMVGGMVNNFNKAADSVYGSFFGGSSAIFYDANGNPLSAAESAELSKLLQGSGQMSSGLFGDNIFQSGMDVMSGAIQNNPVSILTNFFIIGGLIALIGGMVFAVLWYKKSREAEAQCGKPLLIREKLWKNKNGES